MEKKYELVAWTRNVTDSENARVFMIPSVRNEMCHVYIAECVACREELEDNDGYLSLQLARRFVRVYEQSARFDLLAGDYAWAIRFLLMAADYCIHDVWMRTNGELRSEFVRLCEEAIRLASKHGLECLIISEEGPRRTIGVYRNRLRKDKGQKKSAI